MWDIFLGLTTLVRRVANATHTEVSRQVFEKTSQFSAVAAVTGVRPCHNIATLRRSGLHPPDSPRAASSRRKEGVNSLGQSCRIVMNTCSLTCHVTHKEHSYD